MATGLANAQDVYFSGNGNGTGKIWRNNTLVYSISDTTAVSLVDMKVANDSTIFSAGRTFSDLQSHIWVNDSVVFTAEDNDEISRIVIDDNGWTAAGGNKVWQNDSLLYAYPMDTAIISNLYALAVDTVTGDIYAGGTTVTPGVYATVWKNDTILWMAEGWSSIQDLCLVGEDLYAAGFVYGAESIDGVVWQNDSIIFQIEGGEITAITAYNGSLYWAGVSVADNEAYIWQDGEVLFSHPGINITALYVNEYGVYYAGLDNDTATLWKDGEVLYEPEDCESITAIVVLPTEPSINFTITVEVNNDDWGTVTGGGEYALGDTATIEAFPNPGYEFMYWNDSITDNPRDVVVTQDSTFVAIFGQLDFTITTAVVPMNSGTVTGDGIYHYGDTITLEAMANEGYEFERWSDSITDNPRDIIVTQDSTFVALFSRLQFTIEVVSDHPEWGSATGGGTYYYGDTIQIEATPNLGYNFTGWGDGNNDNPRTIIVTEDHTYTAHFSIQQCVISTDVTPENAGTVTGAGAYYYGDTVTLNAIENTGYAFSQWDDGNTDNPRAIIVEGDATYIAVFTPLQYEITTECDPEEGGTVSGAGTYDYGSIVTLTATPNSNYLFTCWSDGIASNPRNITVTGNAHFKALFHVNGSPQYTITVTANDPSLGTVTGGGTYPEGSTIEISAMPYAGAYFVAWDDGNTDNPRSIEVTQDMTFEAIFKETATYTITVSTSNPLQGTTYGSGIYPAGQAVIIGATPSPNFYFSGWQDGDMNNPRTIIVTGDAEYIASFSQNPPQTYTVTVLYDEYQGFILGAGTYLEGSIASIAAIPADGYEFKKWSDDTTDNPKVVLVDHDITLAAFFVNTGVDENDMTIINLYPNPANDIIHIEGLEGQHEVQIYNAFGMLVMTTTLQGEAEINISDLPTGYYLIRIDNRRAVKFIKENK